MKGKLPLIFLAFSASFVIMVLLSFFSVERYSTFTEHSDRVTHSNLVIKMLYKTEVYLKDIDRWERGYLLTCDTSYLRTYHSTIDSLNGSLDILSRLVIDDPLQTKNIIFLRKNINSRLQFSANSIHSVGNTPKIEPGPHYHDGRKYMVASNSIISLMHNIEDKSYAERYKKQQVYEELTGNTLISLLFIFCFITLILFLLLMKLLRSGMVFQEELQGKLLDLKRSHDELQDIAYAISHDLQEPIRKIQVFANMLAVRGASVGNEKTVNTLERINNSASKMQVLIANLVSLTNLSQTNENRTKCDLNEILADVQKDLSGEINRKKALIFTQKLPTVDAYENQMRILFQAIIDNSLKFSRQGIPPKIYVRYDIAKGSKLKDINASQATQQFKRISITDNGIGFDNQHIDNIFRIFRRLHGDQSQYEGKGIGLAICQRIMANHEGYIIGEGEPDEGATFELYFPHFPG